MLGGCRIDGDWSGEVDTDFAEDIKRRCCALVPGLGKPEELKVLKHGVGLRRMLPVPSAYKFNFKRVLRFGAEAELINA